MKNFKFKSQDGFSVIEMLVAVGLMSIVTLGVMTVWGNVSDSQKSVAALQDVSSFETRLKKLMADEVICKNNFGGKNMPAVSTSATSDQLAITRIETTPGGTIVFDQNTKRGEGRVDITGMRIINQYMFTPTKAVANLEIDYKDTSNRTYKRNMPIIFVINAANKIVTCSGNTVIIESATISTACEVMSGGTMFYDQATNKCKLYPTDPFPGSTYTAQCPGTYRVVSCELANNAYIAPQVNLNFTKGGIKPGSIGEYTADPNTGTNSCDCDYTNTFLAASPGVICVARCTQAAQ